MVLHAVVVAAKLSLLAGGHSNWHLLPSLLGPFALKLPFAATRLPTTFSDLAVAVRLFFFRLSRVLFFPDEEAAAADGGGGGFYHRHWHRTRRGRWERALRLFLQMSAGGDLRMLQHNDEMFGAITMLTL